MLIDYVGKWLFPRLQPAQYGQQFKIIAAAIALGLVVGSLMALVMIRRAGVGQ